MSKSDDTIGSYTSDTLKEFTRNRYTDSWTTNPSDFVRIQIILELIGSHKEVLDVGCYDGLISAEIKERGNLVHGIDISQKATDLARQRGILATTGDLDDGLPFPDRSFDVVFAGEVIEHVLDVDFLIDEVNRVLKDKGFVVMTTPNLASLGRRLLLLLGKNPVIETSWKKGSAGHVRYFVKNTLFDLFEAHSFRVERFCTDVVNFDNSGRHFSTRLAKLFPTVGRSLIVKASKTTENGISGILSPA